MEPHAGLRKLGSHWKRMARHLPGQQVRISTCRIRLAHLLSHPWYRSIRDPVQNYLELTLQIGFAEML